MSWITALHGWILHGWIIQLNDMVFDSADFFLTFNLCFGRGRGDAGLFFLFGFIWFTSFHLELVAASWPIWLQLKAYGITETNVWSSSTKHVLPVCMFSHWRSKKINTASQWKHIETTIHGTNNRSCFSCWYPWWAWCQSIPLQDRHPKFDDFFTRQKIFSYDHLPKVRKVVLWTNIKPSSAKLALFVLCCHYWMPYRMNITAKQPGCWHPAGCHWTLCLISAMMKLMLLRGPKQRTVRRFVERLGEWRSLEWNAKRHPDCKTSQLISSACQTSFVENVAAQQGALLQSDPVPTTPKLG